MRRGGVIRKHGLGKRGVHEGERGDVMSRCHFYLKP